jgi:uncharacterized protein YlxW (UPF0749 family)
MVPLWLITGFTWVTDLLKSGLDLYLKHWKITIPATVLVVGFFFVSDHYYDKGLEEGTIAERSIWEDRVKAEQDRNTQLNNQITDVTADYEKRLQEREVERVVEERVVYNTLETIVNATPELQQCAISPQINEQLNLLKALGPEPSE